MSGSRSLSDRYFELLKAHVDEPDEAHLASAGDLGRELVEADVPPEEIGEAHDIAIGRLVGASAESIPADVARRMSSLLTELLMAYGLAFRERLEEREQAERAHMKRTGLAHLGAELWLAADMSRDPLLSAPIEKLTEGFVTHFSCVAWGVVNIGEDGGHMDVYVCSDVSGRRLRRLVDGVLEGLGERLEEPVDKGSFATRVHAQEGRVRRPGEVQAPLLAPLRESAPKQGLAFLLSDGPALGAEDEFLFSMLANQLGVTLENHRLFAEMRELDRMRSEFIAVASHELRTPVHNVQGFVKLAMDPRVTDPDATRDFLKTVEQQADRLAKLVDNFTDAARLEAGRVQMRRGPVQAEELVSSVTKVSEDSAALKEVSFGVRVEPGLSPLHGDRERLQQVLANLVNNATAFSPRGATVAISVEAVDGEVVFSVRDSGMGVPQGALDRIFDRFYQADSSNTRNKEGSGLGLYISKQIVEAHGGRIWAESELGHGSTFRFALPYEWTGGGEGAGDGHGRRPERVRSR